ncbi:MAG: DoxX family protein [Bacteroidales bacterium]
MRINNEIIKSLTIILRIVVGVTFIFSGFVKGIDPIGTAIKLQEYFIGFGIDILSPLSVLGRDFVSTITLTLSVVLAALEFIIGANILFGIYRKVTSWILSLFMIVMTPLTLYLAFVNPVHDCGCFGEALVISNWVTFYKNLVLMITALFLFKYNNNYNGIYARPIRWIPLIYSIIFITSISVFSLLHQPFLDFRPYKNGTDIKAMLATDKVQPEYLFIYEKGGVKKEFTLNNYPATDTTWHFVDRIEKFPPVRDVAPIDFVIRENDVNITDWILNDTTYTFLLFVPSMTDGYDDSWQDRINELYDYAYENSYNFYCLSPDAEAWRHSIEESGINYPCYTMDQTTIETIVRGNPAVALIKEGVLYWKSNPRDLPDMSQISEPLDKSAIGLKHTYSITKRVLFLSFVYLFPLLVLYLAGQGVIKLITKIRRKRKDSLAKSKKQEMEK